MNNLKELSIEDLEKAIAEAKDEEVQMHFVNDKTNVPRFCLEKGIKPGNDLVPGYLIYYTYRKEWQPWSRKKLSKIEFFRHFSKVYTQVRLNHTRCYKLDGSQFDLSTDNLKKIKKILKIILTLDVTLTRKFKNGKKEQKRKAKVSSTTKEVQSEN